LTHFSSKGIPSSSSPFSYPSKQIILVISLVGHYERVAQYLFHDDALRQYPSVSTMLVLRLKPRSLWSLLGACSVMSWYLLARPALLVGIPRSNSRALRLLTALFFRIRYFSYSDGLGDSIHRFHMEGTRNYVGHVGFPSLSIQPLIHEIPLTECVEPWGDHIEFDIDAPVLVLVKTPKETTFDAGHVIRLYARTIKALARHRPVLLSGALPGLDFPATLDVRTLGPLMTLRCRVPISGAVGLPSTAFLTLVTRLPANRLRIMRLGCSRRFPDADQRIRFMKQTLERCMGDLVAVASGAKRHGRIAPESHT
jgi:hypothetical protein